MDRTQTHTRYKRSNSEHLEVNAKLFNVIRKRNISAKEKVKKIKKLLGKKPQPDINAQDGNGNWNTALHMAIERNELEVVNFLLSQGADTVIENGDGKTPLQLAEECNHVEIIDALQSCVSQVERPLSGTHRLVPPTSQPVVANPNKGSVYHSKSHAATTGKQVASTVLPPFSGELRVDKELKLSHDNFKQSIKQFYGNKQLSAIDQLKATPPYPTPHVLAQFASMAYPDCKHGDPKPPVGWQLLTTASHSGVKNGYFGTAYWHPEHQQVVIAHRGTNFKNVGALLTDVKGVLFKNYVQQMNSAITFANKMVAVLQEIEQEKKISFELFFTGHSLGGWLAQITTFTTEYLEVKGCTFLKKLKTEQDETLASSTVQDSNDVTHSYHPHTVVFDSPGCKDMLSQMADKLDVRLNGRSINLQHLDISSYLSAPNLINTCNSHLGTVYRIFTDMSDVGFFVKHTPLYNLATHSMNKIKQTFDPETGQVNKDDKGRLKVREVVDWPVSASLMGGAELNNFFKWAKHLNNYHPEVQNTSYNKVPKGYNPLRYQTKAYDECTKSLVIFNQDQREFLERYRWLCRVKEFFKPEDLFSLINNVETEKEADQKLQNFEFENERIRCPNTSTLHALIPYVKRLVRFFPQIKDKVKDQLSSAQIRIRVYQQETQRYVKKIDQSVLDFKPGSLGLRDFLTSDQQIWLLRMIDGDAWTGLTKVYRVLQNTSCTPSYSSESHYTLLKLKRLLTVNRMINLNALLKSMETPHLLMIACEKNQPVNDEQRDMFKELFSILNQKNTLKIILTTLSDDTTADFIQEIGKETLSEGFIKTEEQLNWSNLTDSSQTAILEKIVIFQGRSVALNQLTYAESMTDSFPLADLLQEKEPRIGKEPVTSASSGYNEKYYIDRTFNNNIDIRQEIFYDKRVGKFADLLASTKQEFKQLCQQNPASNVHWLKKDKSGELVWQQSRGNLKTLRKYVDAKKSHSYSPKDLDNLLEQAKQQRVMLIADKAGMGKTTILTHLSKRIKQKFPAHWLVRIDINDYTEFLEAQKGKKMDKGKVLEFVSKEVLKFETHLEKELFKKSFEGNEVSKVVVMVDGFDEISPSYKETVIDMLQVLKQTSLEQLWVTTRPHLREDLEDTLHRLSYTLQPFSEVEQVEFLKKFWLQISNLKDNDQDRLEVYATALIRKLAESISDKDREFTGIPLQTRMLADAFEQEFILFYVSEKSEPELPHKLDLLGLYAQFIDRKYNIYYKEKSKAEPFNISTKEQRERDFKTIQVEHQLLALEALFTEDQVTFLQNYNHSTFSDEELARIGIAQRNNEGKPHFIHRTFAEYFVADFLINQLKKETKPDEQVQRLLLNEVLLKMDCHVIRAFLDGLLEKSQPSKETLKEYGKTLDEQWNKRKVHEILPVYTSALHEAAKENNVRIIGFLLDSLKSGEHSNTIKKMLLAKDPMGHTVLHMAAVTNNVQVLKLIREWAETVTPAFTYSLLHSQDKDSRTASQLATEGDHKKVGENLWSWAERVQINTGKLHKKLLLAQDSEGRTGWHVAAEMGRVEILDKLWGWAKELQLGSKRLRNVLLLSKDKSGQTAWHMAAGEGHVEVLEKLWDWAKEEKLNSDYLKNVLFLAPQQFSKCTTWSWALVRGREDVIQILWGWAVKLQLTPDELKNKLLLDVDRAGITALFMASFNDNIATLETLWGLSKETQINTDELVKFLSATWHLAAVRGRRVKLERMWLLAGEEHRNPQELKRRMLLEKNKDGKNVWHLAAEGGHIGVLEKLWGWAKGVQIEQKQLRDKLFLEEHQDGRFVCHLVVKGENVEVSDNLLGLSEEAQIKADDIRTAMFLARDRHGQTAWHLAVKKTKIVVLEKLLDWAKKLQLNPDEVRNKLLLDEEEDGRPAWFLAAKSGNVKLLEELWLLARQKGNTKEINSNLLLAQNEYGETALHVAAEGSVVVLEKMWAFAKEAQLNVDELKNKLLLIKDKYGYTAWHRAAVKSNWVALEILWSWAKEAELTPDELLLAKDHYGYTAWHRAAIEGSLEALETLWCWAKEGELNRIKLLLAQNERGETALHIFVRYSMKKYYRKCGTGSRKHN